MTDPIDTVKSAATAEVVQLRTAAKGFEQKQVSWLRANARALIIGAALGAAIVALLSKIL